MLSQPLVATRAGNEWQKKPTKICAKEVIYNAIIIPLRTHSFKTIIYYVTIRLDSGRGPLPWSRNATTLDIACRKRSGRGTNKKRSPYYSRLDEEAGRALLFFSFLFFSLRVEVRDWKNVLLARCKCARFARGWRVSLLSVRVLDRFTPAWFENLRLLARGYPAEKKKNVCFLFFFNGRSRTVAHLRKL